MALTSDKTSRFSMGCRLRPWRLGVALLSGIALAAAPVVWDGVPTAQADQRSDAQQRKEAAQRKQQEIMSSLEGVSAELGQAYLDLQAANAALDTAQTALDSAEATLAQKQREQAQATDRLNAAQAQLGQITSQADASRAQSAENKAAISSLVVSTYQGDSSLSSWTYVLASNSVEELTDRASSMEVASGIQESVLTAAEAERAQLANQEARQSAATERVAHFKEIADTAAAQAQSAASAAQTERDKVAAAQSKAQSAASTLEAKKVSLQGEQAQAQAAEASADATLNKLDAEARAAAAAQGKPVVPSGSASTVGSGSIGRPITGPLIVTSPFGNRFHPILHYWRLHDGVDLAASTGTPQYAAISGRATTGYDSSCGYSVYLNGIVDGNSVVIKYCHLSRQSVSSGQQVTKGQQIGLTGATGGVTGPHVHFSVKINGNYINPMTLPGF